MTCTAQKTNWNCSPSELFSLKHSSWKATSKLCCRNVRSDATWWARPRRKGFGATFPTFPQQRGFGARAASIYRDAGDGGAEGVADLRRLDSKKHVHRNLLTKILKHSEWPKPCMCPVRVGTDARRRKKSLMCQSYFRTSSSWLSERSAATSTTFCPAATWTPRRGRTWRARVHPLVLTTTLLALGSGSTECVASGTGPAVVSR